MFYFFITSFIIHPFHCERERERERERETFFNEKKSPLPKQTIIILGKCFALYRVMW